MRTESTKPRRFIRLREVMQRVGLRPTQIYQMIEENRFPRQVRVGNRAVAWVEDEIIEFQNARIAERDAASRSPSR
jgi:prophage regulatory protein